MTDVSNLDNLAAAIASSSAKIRNYAVAQAAATQSQEADFQAKIAALDARLDVLEAGSPPPPPPPPPVGSTTPNPPIAPITTISDVVIGLNIGNQPQPLWQDYDISNTADSGIIMGPVPGDAATTVRRIRCRNIGGRAAGHPTYGIHGIYCKRANTLIEDFDCELSAADPNNASCLSLRKRGIVIDRARLINPQYMCVSYYEEDTIAGLVTVKNVTGTSASNTGIWISLNTESTCRQAFWFENVHFIVTGGTSFVRAGAGEYSGAGVTIKNCTVNGAKVLAANVTNIAPLTIINN